MTKTIMYKCSNLYFVTAYAFFGGGVTIAMILLVEPELFLFAQITFGH